jgi:glycosyltransferase involved in cell wall biosynthesis
MARFISTADVFALSSRFESGPIVVKESIACGIPVVSLDVGEVKRYLANDALGRVIEQRDEKKFASAICEYLEKKQSNFEVYDQTCEMLVSESWERICSELIQIYERVLGKGGM